MQRQNPVFHNVVQRRGKGFCVNMQMRNICISVLSADPRPGGDKEGGVLDSRCSAQSPEPAVSMPGKQQPKRRRDAPSLRGGLQSGWVSACGDGRFPSRAQCCVHHRRQFRPEAGMGWSRRLTSRVGGLKCKEAQRAGDVWKALLKETIQVSGSDRDSFLCNP